jgi:hypothetical protein
LRRGTAALPIASTGNLYMDIDGDGAMDAFIHLIGVTTLTSAAFVIN